MTNYDSGSQTAKHRSTAPEPAPESDGWKPGEPYITDEEFRGLGDKRGAVYSALGAASVCWEKADLLRAGVFQSDRAKQIGDDLVRYLRTEGGMGRADAAWLEVLLQNAIPRNANGPDNWEGPGRDHAMALLRRVIDGDLSESDATLMKIWRLCEDLEKDAGTHVTIAQIKGIISQDQSWG